MGDNGFLAEGGGSKVLIDGLYRGPRGFVASKDRQIGLREVASFPTESSGSTIMTCTTSSEGG